MPVPFGDWRDGDNVFSNLINKINAVNSKMRGHTTFTSAIFLVSQKSFVVATVHHASA